MPEFENAIENVIDDFLKRGVTLAEMVSTFELKLMALREQEREMNAAPNDGPVLEERVDDWESWP